MESQPKLRICLPIFLVGKVFAPTIDIHTYMIFFFYQFFLQNVGNKNTNKNDTGSPRFKSKNLISRSPSKGKIFISQLLLIL